MDNSFHLRLRRVCWISLMVVQGFPMCHATPSLCYRTPHEAVETVISDSFFYPTLNGKGYRVIKLEEDPILHQRWALIGDCNHPEWIALTFPVRELDGATAFKMGQGLVRALPVIRAGDIVQLWMQEDLLRIEMAGVSEDNGSLGNTIRVHSLYGNANGMSPPAQFTGVVRGPLNVEIQP
jgi:hypothetical protein